MKQVKKLKKVESSNYKNVETPDGLKRLFDEHEKNIRQLGFKIDRLSDLLSRKSTSKLSILKLNKMKKQLDEAKQDHSFSQLILDQVSFRMSQIS